MKTSIELICKYELIYNVSYQTRFKKGNIYKFEKIYNYIGEPGISYIEISYILDEQYYSEKFINSIFYSNSEIRKLKLKKINENFYCINM